jgi:hypothetical protein
MLQCLRRQRRGHLYLIASAPLGHVDGCVRLRDEMFAPDSQGVAGGDTDAAGQVDRLAESVHTHRGNPLQDALRNGMCGRRVGTAQNHDELLASVAADDVRLPQFRMNGVDDGAQARVPGLMAERIVDLLEMIEIDEQERDRQTARPRSQASRVETLDELSTLGEYGVLSSAESRQPDDLWQCNCRAGSSRVEIGLRLLRRVHHHHRYARRRYAGRRETFRGLELQPKCGVAAAQLGAPERLELAVERTAGHRTHRRIERRGAEDLNVEGRFSGYRRRRKQIADAGENASGPQAARGALTCQYCRDSSQ